MRDSSKLKAFADDNIKVTQKLKFVLGRVENIVEKGENVVTSIFSFFRNVFKVFLSQSHENIELYGRVKSGFNIQLLF